MQARKNSSATLKAPPARSDSTSTFDSDSFSFNAMKQQLFKTKMCRHFINGRCKYSEKCTFSHDQSELTVRTDFAKTKLCKKVSCVDPNCGYAHSVEELRVPTASLCPQTIQKGKCSDPACMFSHNTTYFDELAVARKASKDSTKIESPAFSSHDVSTPTMAAEPLAADLVNTLIRMLSMAQADTQA
jgi:hypothetical protein